MAQNAVIFRYVVASAIFDVLFKNYRKLSYKNIWGKKIEELKRTQFAIVAYLRR